MNRIPHESTKIFTDIYSSSDEFLNGWKESGLYSSGIIADSSVTKLFFLLYSRYANSSIINWDENQFKYRVYATIFQYGPTWEKRLDIQNKLRGLTETELLTGSKQIYNHAYNPSTAPSTSTLEEIDTINDQNTTNNKKSKMEAYALLMDLLQTDVTGEFLDKFRPLFNKFIYVRPDIYVTETEDNEDEGSNN